MNQMMGPIGSNNHHSTENNTGGLKKNKVSMTAQLYYRYKSLKDRNRAKLIQQHKEEEKLMKKKAIKKGGGSEQLQSLNSFEKQAANNEYAEFIAQQESLYGTNEAITRKNTSKQASINNSAPSQGPSGFMSYLGFTIRQNDSWKIWWDSTILIIAIFNSVTIPLQISF